ncbi:hypothetical protein PMAYCL1PPCAC_06137 [Pristionchus mayeri]|uniref:Uncharacterized protein n=1 Tax=Pristionchus mayeri TaxID=1317129 RepID=A0AAN5CAM2_9BILA|nr:hypothetical protein PMAYCL1PPCAC_06137 [Pristionchus mayeri]
MEEAKKKKVSKEEDPDPGAKLAPAGSWILYPLTGGIHMQIKCRIVCYCEGGLSFIFAVLGFCNVMVEQEIALGYIQIINGVFLLCLFLEFLFGYRYRSPALLYLHTVQCVFVAFMAVVATIFSLTLIDHEELSGKSIRKTMSDLHSTAISYTLILLSLAITSWTRARDLLKIHRELPLHALSAVNRRLRQTAGIMPE